MRSGLVCSSQVLAAKTPIKIYPPQADYRHVPQSQKSPPAGMLMTYCKQCLEKQQKINELEEEITRLQGKEAVRLAMKEDSGSVAIRRLRNKPKYAVELFRTELCNVAEKTRSMPAEFINAEGNGVTDAFIEYASPLIGKLPKTEYLGNYPKV
jgi:hypothetical protein